MNLLPDWTLFLQLFVFLALVFSLNVLLFRPALRVLDERKGATEGTKQEIARLQADTEQKLREYEDQLLQARLRGVALKDRLKKEGDEEAGRIISKARQLSESLMMELEARLASEQQEVELQLKKDLPALAKKMTEQVMRRTI